MKPLHTGVVAGAAALVLSLALQGVAEPQPSLRIGGSISKTGAYTAIGQNVLRGYQLCVKHTNEKGGVLGRKMDINTVFGPFRVDRDGVQLAHRMATYQWQDGKKVIVWPEEVAPGKPRFPTPPWSQRP